MLECPLPVDALAYLSNFLALSRLDTRSLRSETTAPEPPVSTSISSTSSTCSKIGELASACQVQIQRVENQNFLAQRLAETSFPNTRAADDSSTQLSPLLAASVHSSTYQEAMHVALMRAMEERDEAQARMVAAEVLHVHEMDQQRKKTAHFAAQMEAEKATSQDDKSFDKAKAMTTRISQQMQQNSDAELLALCQQLAGEISGRTEAALEVSRLKETRQIERDCEIREKKALLQEIDHLKQLLAQEQQKTESAQEASGNWKKSFQEAVQAQEQLHPVGHEPQEEE